MFVFIKYDVVLTILLRHLEGSKYVEILRSRLQRLGITAVSVFLYFSRQSTKIEWSQAHIDLITSTQSIDSRMLLIWREIIIICRWDNGGRDDAALRVPIACGLIKWWADPIPGILRKSRDIYLVHNSYSTYSSMVVILSYLQALRYLRITKGGSQSHVPKLHLAYAQILE